MSTPAGALTMERSSSLLARVNAVRGGDRWKIESIDTFTGDRGREDCG